ncbi:uncharacterized protein LOC111012406 [Momordica charantia]|uniref:soluble epoxide hydrolase n=1 Tax=Momordica charantia TaxID=3673 RepID=A0A6J1CMT7_MOMCH|nr:uncharacterized protein LOC111012406 [Momordica charantia]
MEAIEHQMINTNGIKMHVASIGTGPVVLLLHGFPELWYSWRHHLLYLSSVGYRAIAPDLRGYGDTDSPPSPESYTAFHLVGDLVGVLDELGIDKVYLVGHDWGAYVAWYFSLFRPDRIKALVALSVEFFPRNPKISLIESYRAAYGDDFYMCKFKIPGLVEQVFGYMDPAELFKGIFSNRSTNPLFMHEQNNAAKLPSWLTEQDINYYADKYKRKGFTGPLNYYRAFDRSWELTAPWTGAQIQVPAKFIVGDSDLTYHFKGAKEYIHKGGFKRDVPFLEEAVVMEDTCHFINQERVHETCAHIHDFIKKF